MNEKLEKIQLTLNHNFDNIYNRFKNAGKGLNFSNFGLNVQHIRYILKRLLPINQYSQIDKASRPQLNQIINKLINDAQYSYSKRPLMPLIYTKPNNLR